jgi:sorting nexin-4
MGESISSFVRGLTLVSQNTRMHQHAHTPASPTDDGPTSLLDNVTDTLLNAFAKVRKPDERFVEIVEELDKFEEALSGVDRIEARTRSRTSGGSVLGRRSC